MCHCALCFAAQPRCPALARDTESPGCAVKLAVRLVGQVQRIARWGIYSPHTVFDVLKHLCKKASTFKRAGCETEEARGDKESWVVARNGSTENPEHCGNVEPSSIKEETKRKVTSRKMEAQRRVELVCSWSWLVLLCPSAGDSIICVFLLYAPTDVIASTAVYAAHQRRTFRASQIGGFTQQHPGDTCHWGFSGSLMSAGQLRQQNTTGCPGNRGLMQSPVCHG